MQARQERRLEHRSPVLRLVRLLAILGFAVVVGVAALLFGRGLAAGDPFVSIDLLRLGVLALLVAVGWDAGKRTLTRNERIETDLLLTTVPGREVALGLCWYALGRAAMRSGPSILATAIGFAVGTGSITGGLTVAVAGGGLVAVGVIGGVWVAFVALYVGTRSPRARRYKNPLALVGALALVGVWIGLIAGSFDGAASTADVRVDASAVAPTWIVDLAFLGTAGAGDASRGLAALGALAVAVPVLGGLTVSTATRVWTTDAVESTARRGSHLRIGEGPADRLFGASVSRPTLAVARKRWLQERRVPYGVMVGLYTVMFVPLVVVPFVTGGRVPPVIPVFAATVCALTAGLAFGVGVINVEYPGLPGTLTATTATHFVGGTVLAGSAVGIPATALAAILTGVAGPIGAVETAVVAAMGATLCLFSVCVATLVGLTVPYDAHQPVGLPYTDATVYTEVGTMGFVRMGAVLVAVASVALVPIVVYSPFVFEPIGTATGLPDSVVRMGSLLAATGLALGLSRLAYDRSLRRYGRYRLEE